MKTESPVTPLPCVARLLAAAVLLALAACDRSDSKVASAPPPVPVQTAVASRQDVPRRIDSIGAVQSLRTVTVKSQVDGIIAKVHFQEGQDVQAGDLLVTLDQRPFQNNLRIARADLANAKAEAEQADADATRYTRLDQQNAISKEQFAQLLTKAATTKALVQAKEAAVANAELQLSYSEIRAPITGRTGQLMLHEGALMKANDNSFTLVTINQLAPIAVAYSVPEASLEAIRAALAEEHAAVTVVDRATGLKREDGKLGFFDNTVDSTTGMITLKAVFPNADHTLWPGRFVNVTTTVGIDLGATVVPTPAVQTSQNGSVVFVVKADGSVDLRSVKIVRNNGDFTLLASGVNPGETVVTDGQLRLVPGSKVVSKNLSEVASPAEAQPAKKS